MSKTHLIYLPGLGDTNLSGQEKAINTFKIYGIAPQIFSLEWSKPAAGFAEKILQLNELIIKLSQNGDRVVLMGVSGGASAALIALHSNPEHVAKVVLICGKVQNLDQINPAYFAANPRFSAGVDQLDKILPQLESSSLAGKVLSIRPLLDPIVPVKDTKVKGAKNIRFWFIGHSTTIGWGITFWSWRSALWLKK